MANSPLVQQRGAIQFVRLCLENTPVLLCLIMSIIRCEGKTKHVPAAFSPLPLAAARSPCIQMSCWSSHVWSLLQPCLEERGGFEMVLPAELQLLFCVCRERLV